jgi:hypothetical protein
MTENTDASVSEDEISLIDLLVVLLKRRWLIILSTLVAMILGLAMVLLLPGYQYSKAVAEQVAEGTTSFMISPALKAILGEAESASFINQGLNDPQTILLALREAGYEELDDRTRIDAGVPDQEAVFSVRRRFIQNKNRNGTMLKPEQVVYKVTVAGGMGTISFKNKDEDKIKTFLTALTSIVNAELDAYCQPYALSKVESFEALLRVEKPSEVVGLTIVQNHANYTLIQNYLDERISPITILREPHVFKTELSLEVFQKEAPTKAIILVFAVFFLSVFAAFVLQFVESVKKDPESMEKIRDALAKPRT